MGYYPSWESPGNRSFSKKQTLVANRGRKKRKIRKVVWGGTKEPSSKGGNPRQAVRVEKGDVPEGTGKKSIAECRWNPQRGPESTSQRLGRRKKPPSPGGRAADSKLDLHTRQERLGSPTRKGSREYRGRLPPYSDASVTIKKAR